MNLLLMMLTCCSIQTYTVVVSLTFFVTIYPLRYQSFQQAIGGSEPTINTIVIRLFLMSFCSWWSLFIHSAMLMILVISTIVYDSLLTYCYIPECCGIHRLLSIDCYPLYPIFVILYHGHSLLYGYWSVLIPEQTKCGPYIPLCSTNSHGITHHVLNCWLMMLLYLL